MPPIPVILFLAVSTLAGVLLIRFIDARYLELVQAGATKNSELAAFLTDIGKSDWILVLTGAGILIFTFYTADRYQGALKRVWHRLLLTLYFLFTAVAFSGLLTNLFKFLFGRVRPLHVEGTDAWISQPLTAGYEFASFPSGHSTTSGALAMALALLFPRFRMVVLPLGAFLALTRNMVGAHFPSDVLAGFLFGASFTWLYARSFARKRLLFHFEASGKLGLRGEGSGHLHRWRELFAKNAAKRRAVSG